MIMTKQSCLTHLHMYWNQGSLDILGVENETNIWTILNHTNGRPIGWEMIVLDNGVRVCEG